MTVPRWVRLSSFVVLVQVLAIAAIAVVAGFVWVNAIKTLTNPVKVPPPIGSPQSLVWNHRVFTTRASLDAYLRHRGYSYVAWARKHPEAAAVVEHRPVVVTAPSPAAKAKAKAKAKAAHAQATATTATKETSRKVESAPAAKRSAPPPSGGSNEKRSLSALGWLIALLLGALALAPARWLARFRVLRAGPSFRTYSGAAAATIIVVLLLAGVS